MSMIGKSLIHYEISTLIGRGGMGEVYQAKDTKLGRDVAIKILPEEFAKDADRVARFQREAKLLASLNHPNIAVIYGLEESDGINLLVMELIEGDTLAGRIKTGPIRFEETLKLALQIAEALEAAHEKGVIHRDLKPANIKITPDGNVKILDFGLAKAFIDEQGEEKPLDSPTLSNAATQHGVILGTAAYMSPEQAKGKSVDKLADIWAFGVVVFEMLTGQQLFTGETASETLAAVMMRDPDFSKLPPNLHIRIKFLLERCLEKDPKDRYSGISDARVEIQKVLTDPSGIFAQPLTIMRPRKKFQVGLWVATALVLGLVIAGLSVWKLKPIEPHKTVRFYHDLLANQQPNDLSYPILAVSPDSNQFVYSTNKGFYIRSLDGFNARLIKGTSGELMHPCFSPDGQSIVYFSRDTSRLEKIAVSGGVALPLCDTGLVMGVFWNIDNTIIYSEYGTGVLRVSSNGGKPEVLIRDKEVIYHPRLLSDGNSVMFTIGTSEGYKTVIQSLNSDKRKELLTGDTAFYLPTGHIVYALENYLYAAAFDLNSLKVTNGGVPLIPGVLRAGGAPQFAVSGSGTLVYIPGDIEDTRYSVGTLVWVDREGNEEPIPATPKAYYNPRVSPNGDLIALSIITGGHRDIWIWDSVRESPRRLTTNESADILPLWSLGSNRILFSSNRNGSFEIFSRAADGTGEDDLIYSAGNQSIFPSSWSDNGKNLICYVGGESNYDISMLSLENDGKLKPLLKSKSDEWGAIISPDGRSMAYASNESGQFEVYVRPFPEVDKQKIQISTNGGNKPLWSLDGREVFYRDGESVIAVSVETEPKLKAGKTNTLFQDNYLLLDNYITWSINPKTGKFLMIKSPQMNGEPSATGSSRINIVVNWDEEIKQKVPVD